MIFQIAISDYGSVDKLCSDHIWCNLDIIVTRMSPYNTAGKEWCTAKADIIAPLCVDSMALFFPFLDTIIVFFIHKAGFVSQNLLSSSYLRCSPFGTFIFATCPIPDICVLDQGLGDLEELALSLVPQLQDRVCYHRPTLMNSTFYNKKERIIQLPDFLFYIVTWEAKGLNY